MMKVNYGSATLDVEHYLRKEYENIGQAAEEIPNLICWLGELRGWAVQRFMNAESAWKKAEATAYFALKNGGEFQARGLGERITEDALKHAVQLDPIVRECADSYADLRRKMIQVEETIDAFKLKIDLIRSNETTRRMVITDEPRKAKA